VEAMSNGSDVTIISGTLAESKVVTAVSTLFNHTRSWRLINTRTSISPVEPFT
jgi:hypothetical protein